MRCALCYALRGLPALCCAPVQLQGVFLRGALRRVKLGPLALLPQHNLRLLLFQVWACGALAGGYQTPPHSFGVWWHLAGSSWSALGQPIVLDSLLTGQGFVLAPLLGTACALTL